MDSVSNHVNRKAKFGKRKIVTFIVGVLLVVAVLALGNSFFRGSSTAATIDSSRYQAVFFSNDQVYFGKLKQVNDEYFKLTDVFYIQAQDGQAAGGDSENPQQSAGQSNDIRLIKLGSEVHGPDDELIISKEQILFFENLKKDGKVSESINNYNKDKDS